MSDLLRDPLRDRTRAVPQGPRRLAGARSRAAFGAVGARGHRAEIGVAFGRRERLALHLGRRVHGGAAQRDYRYDQIVAEELGRINESGLALSLHSSIIAPYLDRYGTAEQKARWLPKAVSGEAVLAIAMTEPGAGSDLAGTRTRAVPTSDGGWRLSGSKTCISNGINADLVIVAARPTPRARGASACSSSSRAWPASNAGASSTSSATAARTRPSCSSTRCRCRRPTCSANRRRASTADGDARRRAPHRGLHLDRHDAAAPSTRRSPTSSSARPSASRSAPSRTRASSWPSCAPRSTARRPSSTPA